MKRLILTLVFILLLPLSANADWEGTLVPDPANPIFDPAATRAYYPSVLYDADGFGNGDAGPFYRMWYSAGAAISVTESDDGIAWGAGVDASTGLTNAHHVQVVYDADRFGGAGPLYKIWYWNTALLYDIATIRYAESDDGIVWVSDQAITQDACPDDCIIDNSMPVKWNRGSYGPVSMHYNPNASNSGTDPFDYSYAMYYDATTGGIEQVGLGYSPNGIHWTIAGSDAVLKNTAVWNITHTSFGTVIREAEGEWHFFYSGGDGSLHDGIGHASSTDGITWVQDADNPFIEREAGTWIEQRAYAPSILYDADRYDGHGDNSQFKLWLSGRDAGGNYAIGYYGRDVSTLIVEEGENSPSTIEAEPGDTKVVLSQVKLTNDDVEAVDLSSVTENLVGDLLQNETVSNVEVYHDADGDGVLNPDTDELLGSATPAENTVIAIDDQIATDAVRYWLVAVDVGENAEDGNELIISIDSSDEVGAAGAETNETDTRLLASVMGKVIVTAEPTPPTPPYGIRGGGGCFSLMNVEAAPVHAWTVIILLAPLLAMVVWRFRSSLH